MTIRRNKPGGSFVRSAEGSAVGRSEAGAKAALDLAKSAAEKTLPKHCRQCNQPKWPRKPTYIDYVANRAYCVCKEKN